MRRASVGVVPAWARAKKPRIPSSTDISAEVGPVVEGPVEEFEEDPAEDGDADAVHGLSFEEIEEKNNCRLEAINAMTVEDFNASKDSIVQEVHRMRPRVKPGLIHEGAMFVKTLEGNLLFGKPHHNARQGPAWNYLMDVSEATGVKDKMVYLRNFHEVGAPAYSFE